MTTDQKTVLALLRAEAKANGLGVYFSTDYLAKKLGWKAKQLYDHEHDCGLLYHLFELGLIDRQMKGFDRAFWSAVGEMQWD